MLWCKDTAFREFIKYLILNKYVVKSQMDFNKCRHRLITTDKGSFYVVYKRDFYNSFGTFFESFMKKFPFYEGIGESINSESLDIALYNNVNEIIFIHKDGYYSCYPQLIKKLNLTRKQDKSNLYSSSKGYTLDKEETYSVPIELLRKW